MKSMLLFSDAPQTSLSSGAGDNDSFIDDTEQTRARGGGGGGDLLTDIHVPAEYISPRVPKQRVYGVKRDVMKLTHTFLQGFSHSVEVLKVTY